MLRSGMRSVRDYLNQSAEIEDSVLINSHVEGRLPRGIGVTRLRDEMGGRLRAATTRAWIEGRTVAIEYRWAEGRKSQRPHVACELPQPPARGDRLGGVPAMPVFAARAIGTSHPYSVCVRDGLSG